MEVANIILQFVSVMIWPIFLFVSIFWFKQPIFRIIEKILTNSKQIDLELGGQKISVKLAEQVVKDAIATALPDTKDNLEPNQFNRLSAESTVVLRVLSKLNDDDLKFLCQEWFPFPTRTEGDQESMEKLRSLGLIRLSTTSSGLEHTKLGWKIVSIVGKRSIDDVLHKIGQAL